jgi:hypothetical protein
MMKHSFVILLLAVAVGSCDSREPARRGDVPQATVPATREPPDSAADVCRKRINAVEMLANLGGLPDFEAQRAQILATVPAEPVLFVRVPEPVRTLGRDAERYRERLARVRDPWLTLGRIVRHFKDEKQEARNLLLREGYLVADNPTHAYALLVQIKPQHLFDEPEIWIQRGAETRRARRRSSGVYYYVDGSDAGAEAELLPFDRIGTGPVPRALHRELRSLRDRLGFDRMVVRHLTDGHVSADLRYGDIWVPTLLAADDARLNLVCEAITSDRAEAVERARAENRARRRVVGALRKTMLEQMHEQLPFDEPRTEIEQQDGKLRARWRRAYRDGSETFKFNGDRYWVFDPKGRPLVPQVCTDFVVDTIERASGTWWRGRGKPPGREQGLFAFTGPDRSRLRDVLQLVEFAQSNPDWFEVYTVPEAGRVPFEQKREFYGYLLENASTFQSGDIVVIKGYVPWDERRMAHFHSFFVYETDPVTGMPLVVAGNPGRPVLRSWEQEVRRTPKRSILHRVRPRLPWLESILKLDDIESDSPAPLVIQG